ncbi:MAG: HlyD family efflux transporter periplasmic adaptor subunit [Pseudanabaenaceae cyanobacterium SKYGB_i_bin29]|nr:HlyD family efflux transporter periplasmic adaptor subunit [Pseudanabaenaceae cyanobacterium SKYG29]MDW8421192.1 HlyD family efflux transporter periplasmic adaptor subunit [Pseudanabaenaceae cyanobacterium SKYGB_i_bin29]
MSTIISPPTEKLVLPAKFVRRAGLFRWFRLLWGLGLLGLGAYLAWYRFGRVVSRVGYVNAPIIHIHAPMEGVLQLESVQPGQFLPQGTGIGKITNARNPQLEIDLQKIRTELQVSKQKLENLEGQLAQRQQLYQYLVMKAEQQSQLDLNFFRANLERSRRELRSAQAQLALAEKEFKRFTDLAAAGVVPPQRADQALAELHVAQEAVASRQAEMEKNRVALAATEAGLQIDSARTFSFPAIRLLELEREITDLQKEKQTIKTQILQLAAEIKTATKQLQLAQTEEIKTPVDSVVWSVHMKTGTLGTHVGAGTPLLQLVNCADVWVSALVAERASPRLRVGQLARIRFLDGTDRVLRGRVRAIRGGPGRVRVGMDVAVPTPELVRNEVEVQFELVGTERKSLQSGHFCGVGQSVEVEFLAKEQQ